LRRGFVAGRGSGKSWVGAYDLIIRARPGRTYIVCSPTYTILEDTTLPTFRTLAQEIGVWRSARMTPHPNVTLTEGQVIRFRSTENPETLRGPNLSGAWLDEASLMDQAAYEIVLGSLREKGELGFLTATMTPKGLAHWTYDAFGTQQPNTEIFHAKTSDNPFVHQDFASNLAKVYTGNFARQELGGEFVAEDDSSQVIPESWVRIAQERWTPDGHRGEPMDALGCDIAHGGADRTILAPRHRHWFGELICYEGSQTPSGAMAALKIKEALRVWPGAMVLVDCIGYGAPAAEACGQAGMNAFGIDFGVRTKARDRTGILSFRNVRAFAYWSFRELLDPANGFEVALPPDRELLQELCAPTWKSPGGLVIIEKKDDIKKRLPNNRSPDKADAVVLASLLPSQELTQ